MKLTIDMLEFLKTGKFDHIELGQTQEWILNNFADPDGFVDDGRFLTPSNIWLYGKIEFHFSNHQLVMIFSDHFQSNIYGKNLHAGDNIIIKPWIFKNPKKLTLDYVIHKFIKVGIDFQKVTTSYSIDLILPSRINLIFQNPNDSKNRNPNRYLMMAFAFTK